MDAGPKEGIIGFFDILGYQSFLQNNSAEYAAKEVFSTLTNLDKKIPESLSKTLETKKEEISQWFSSIEWLIFSDTILLTSAFNEEGKEVRNWMSFIIASLTLNSHMFKFGLPLRGAITTGKYFIEKGCFAGESIIEAYKLTQDINLAACIITDKAYENILFYIGKGDSKMNKLLSTLVALSFTKYPVPRKSGEKGKLYTLNLSAAPDFPFADIQDLHQGVLDCFWKHNKDVSPEAESKVHNTERFFRYLKYTIPDFFGSSKTEKPGR